jgi:hypothetical protein
MDEQIKNPSRGQLSPQLKKSPLSLISPSPIYKRKKLGGMVGSGVGGRVKHQESAGKSGCVFVEGR